MFYILERFSRDEEVGNLPFEPQGIHGSPVQTADARTDFCGAVDFHGFRISKMFLPSRYWSVSHAKEGINWARMNLLPPGSRSK